MLDRTTRATSTDFQDPSSSQPAETSTARTRRKDKFDRYAWRDNVIADTDTPQNVKLLVFGIAKYVNGETGEAVPSTITLAKVCGRSEKWVRNTIPKLHNTGWAVIELGSQGRGKDHCNRYLINPEKRTPCTLLAGPKKRRFEADQKVPKPDFWPVKPDTGSEEPLNPKAELMESIPPITTTECCETCSTARVDGVNVTSIECAPNGARERLEYQPTNTGDSVENLAPLARNGDDGAPADRAPGLDDGTVHAHVSPHREDDAMYVDANYYFPTAGQPDAFAVLASIFARKPDHGNARGKFDQLLVYRRPEEIVAAAKAYASKVENKPACWWCTLTEWLDGELRKAQGPRHCRSPSYGTWAA